MSWRHLVRRLKDGLITSWRRRQNVLKIYWRHFCKTSWRRFQDVLASHPEDVLKTFWKCFQDALITYDQDQYIGLDQDVSRHLEDVFLRRMIKVNIFVLIKTAWRRLLKMKTKDVFKTFSSRRMFAGKPPLSTLDTEKLITEEDSWERGL